MKVLAVAHYTKWAKTADVECIGPRNWRSMTFFPSRGRQIEDLGEDNADTTTHF